MCIYMVIWTYHYRKIKIPPGMDKVLQEKTIRGQYVGQRQLLHLRKEYLHVERRLHVGWIDWSISVFFLLLPAWAWRNPRAHERADTTQYYIVCQSCTRSTDCILARKSASFSQRVLMGRLTRHQLYHTLQFRSIISSRIDLIFTVNLPSLLSISLMRCFGTSLPARLIKQSHSN